MYMIYYADKTLMETDFMLQCDLDASSIISDTI